MNAWRLWALLSVETSVPPFCMCDGRMYVGACFCLYLSWHAPRQQLQQWRPCTVSCRMPLAA